MPTTCRCRPARCHAHVIRSPHPHADIVGIDTAAALAMDGVWAVITGEDIRKISDPFLVALKSPIHQWSLAVERVRYVGEPVALVVAESRYIAEDAAELVQIDYAPLEAVIDPLEASKHGAPILHPEAKTNEISVREFQLRRHQDRVREGRPARQADGRLPPALVHADGMLRLRRAIQSGGRQLRLPRQLPGAVQHASGDGAGAARRRARRCGCAFRRTRAAASASSFRCFPTWC